MEFESTAPERPLSVPGEVTQHLVDAYSASVIRTIFTKVKEYHRHQQMGRLDANLHLEQHELLFIEKYCNEPAGEEVHVETPKECTIGKGETQLKVNLGVFHKMKEKKLMTEVVSKKNLYGEDIPGDIPEPERPPVVHNTVNKNAYEIRLDVLKEATKMADGDSKKALQIAESFYKFVENKRRL